MREFKITNYSVSSTEIVFYIITVLVLSFLYVFNDVYGTWLGVAVNLFNVVVILSLSFLFQQLVQKSVAQVYGASTRYKLWIPGLMIACVVGLFSLGDIVVFAVGIVSIQQFYGSRLGKKSVKLGEDERGKIVLSGVLANLFLAFLIKLLAPFLNEGVWFAGVMINLWMAFYNLVPVPPLQGSYVFMWNRVVWAVVTVLTLSCLVMMPFIDFMWVALLALGLGFVTFLFVEGYKLG